MEWFQWITTLCPAGLTHLPLTRQAFNSTPTWWNFGTLLQTVFVKHTTNPGFKGLIEGYCAMLLHKNIPNICAEPLDIKRSIWIKQDLRGRPHMNTSKSTQWDGGMATGQDTKRKEKKKEASNVCKMALSHRAGGARWQGLGTITEHLGLSQRNTSLSQPHSHEEQNPFCGGKCCRHWCSWKKNGVGVGVNNYSQHIGNNYEGKYQGHPPLPPHPQK